MRIVSHLYLHSNLNSCHGTLNNPKKIMKEVEIETKQYQHATQVPKLGFKPIQKSFNNEKI